MSLNWDEDGKKFATGPRVEFRIKAGTRIVTDEDGRKVVTDGEFQTEPCVDLLRKVQYDRSTSRWALAGQFDDEESARAYAEKIS